MKCGHDPDRLGERPPGRAASVFGGCSVVAGLLLFANIGLGLWPLGRQRG